MVCGLLFQQLAEAVLQMGAIAFIHRFDSSRALVGRGLLQSSDVKEMLACQHSVFLVDAGVCIEAQDRAALERLWRYCVRPPFAMDRSRTCIRTYRKRTLALRR